jgi:hypothetical protein
MLCDHKGIQFQKTDKIVLGQKEIDRDGLQYFNWPFPTIVLEKKIHPV